MGKCIERAVYVAEDFGRILEVWRMRRGPWWTLWRKEWVYLGRYRKAQLIEE